ncbi:MAG TPA: 1,4-alpha-glucan branching protein GlgB [Rhodanobacteraceae bacterium]|nr:1,4-alpha-glucan branching protein GlgB [Rhodanobacteraceae bacterium]
MSIAAQIPHTDDIALDALLAGRHADPFAVLGPHRYGDGVLTRVFMPGALEVEWQDIDGRQRQPMRRIREQGLFAIERANAAGRYQLCIQWPDARQVTEDAYAFGLLIDDADLNAFASGDADAARNILGALPCTIDGVQGVRFAVWAPQASRVSVVGPFNAWDGRRHPMRKRHVAGVWELFIPRLEVGERYQYELLDAHGNLLPLRADPMARWSDAPPGTASRVASRSDFTWHDRTWMQARGHRQRAEFPISVYEVHAGSWMDLRGDDDREAWDRLGDRLIPYVHDMGFTHVELLPVATHPFGGSWGYQPLGLLAPMASLGSPVAFARFIDRCHMQGIGVLIDWVPGHFPTDVHGMGRFDGSALYEHADPREGFHPDWKTFIYNFGRNEVRAFLLASALEWLLRYHVDGLRVDAVASMLFRDYSRRDGEWIANMHGGRENYEAVAFLKDLNRMVEARGGGAITIAEESTAWPGVTAPCDHGGLGFSYKWNMGWMNDTLRYFSRDPIHRSWHHDDITFGLLYAFGERYVLPLSHDEVVHGKRSLLGRMPGDAWQRLANLRALFGLMWAYPGKKLLFMGGEIAMPDEWNHDQPLPWFLLDAAGHKGMQRLVRDLNRGYATESALHATDSAAHGFRWVVADDRGYSVFAFLRINGDSQMLVACNLTPQPRHAYRLPVPDTGVWREILNTDAEVYGGSGDGNGGAAHTHIADDASAFLELELPPLAVLWLRRERE